MRFRFNSFIAQLRSGTFTGDRTITLPDKSGAIALDVDILSRQTFSNADVTVSATATQLAQTGTLTAARTVTLPLANSKASGFRIDIVGESGTSSSANKIILARSGSDLINGVATLDAITFPNGAVYCVSDGVSRWSVFFFDNNALVSSSPATGATPPSTPVAGQQWNQTDANGFILLGWQRSEDNTLWLSRQIYYCDSGSSATISSTTTNLYHFTHTEDFDILLETFTARGRAGGASSPGGAVDSNTSYFTFECRTWRVSAASTALSPAISVSMQARTYAISNTFFLSAPVGQQITRISDNSALVKGFFIQITKFAAAPNLGDVAFHCKYRLIYS